jgi:hypothetical protein
MEQEIATMHVHHTTVDTKVLKQLWSDLTEEEKVRCRSQFGPLEDLVNFGVNWDFIKAIAWF